MPAKKSRRGGGESAGKRSETRTTPSDRTSEDAGAKTASTESEVTSKTPSTTAKSPARKSLSKKSTATTSKAASKKPAAAVTESKADPAELTDPAARIGTYHSAVKWLLELTDVERQRVVRYDEDGDFKLDRMRSLLAALGDPQDQFRAVHVAGTNGKGSTIAMMSAMLRKCGYGVGEFTSPHLMDMRERVTINGQRITKNDFVESMKTIARSRTWPCNNESHGNAS